MASTLREEEKETHRNEQKQTEADEHRPGHTEMDSQRVSREIEGATGRKGEAES